MSKPDTLVVIIDSQVDFMMQDGRLPVAGAEEIIAPGIRFLANLDPSKVAAVLMTFDTHSEESFIGSPENLGNSDAGEPGFPIHCEKGTPGWENVFNPAIIPTQIAVHSLEKGVFNMWEEPTVDVISGMFGASVVMRGGGQVEGSDSDGRVYRSDRDRYFAHLHANGITKAIVIGVAADFCVKYAIEGLLKRGFDVTVPAHLTRGIIRQIDQVAAEDFPGATLTIAE